MILPDHEIIKLCKAGMVHPFDESLVGPASLDVRLGDAYRVPDTPRDYWRDGRPHPITSDKRLYIEKGMFVLAATLETFNFPDDICAHFALRSSWARKGLSHLMAGFCDPGWHGSVLTMELTNMSPMIVGIPHGEPIGQLVFMRLESPPTRTYAETGRYNNDSTVSGAK